MILITGAAGKTGKAVLRALTKRGQLVKALVFRSEQVREVEGLGAKDILLGDMRNPDILQTAMQGVDSVYHICPNVHPDEIRIGQAMINVAVANGITYFVYHSVLHPQIESMPHHWNKMRVEECLFESGLFYTILQPAVYMQNILVNWESIIQTGKYTIPYPIDTQISMVDLEDVALAATVVLMDTHQNQGQPLHHAATYELVGTQPLSQIEVATILSQQLGRPVVAESLPLDTWEIKARASGLGDYQVNTLVNMFTYYGRYGFSGDSHVLGWLLNRPATGFDAFVKREAEDRLHFVQ